MSKIEVVVATMNQQDFSLVQKMNISTDAVIANQCDRSSIEEKMINNHRIKYINTPTKGVGLNRNIGLSLAENDILLLADDDIIYVDDYARIIISAFNELKDADVIIFRMRFIKNGKEYDIDKHSTRKLHIWNGLSYGTYQIAIKRKAVQRINLHFTHLFGGGCIYSAGEDSLFLIDCFKKGLNVYSHEGLIGENIRDSSSWFNGFNEKFFFDRGIFAACAFPKLKYFLIAYYLYAYRAQKNYKTSYKWKLMKSGCENFRNLQTYEEWKNL